MPRAILFDLDGTIYEDGVPLPGAAQAVAELRRRGIEVGFVTNTTSRSRRLLSERLREMNIETPPERIVTALLAGAAHLAAQGYRRVAPLVPALALEDLAGFEIVTERPEAVVVGDLDDRWNFEILNTAFNQLMGGAELIALSADRYWRKDDVLQLDCGPFVKALEYASGKSAAICGKPSAEFYRAALGSLGTWALERPGDVLMVGDDIWGDIKGAQEAGLEACLVRTGKFRADALAASGVRPDHVIED
ncbi:MAG: TIGR01458 family HAD-type hydrolase, partial [Gemmatimonadales bacterium]